VSGRRLVSLISIVFFMAVSVNGQQSIGVVEQPKARELFMASRMKRKSVDSLFVLIASRQLLQDSQQSRSQIPVSGRKDCAYLGDALRATEQRVERDENIVTSTSHPDGNSTTGDPKVPAVDLQYDLKVLEHDKAELDKCVAWIERAKPDPTKNCSSSEFFDFHVTHNDEPTHDVQVWRQPESSAFFFESSLSVDADGAPNAYHPDNNGLDDLANAGAPGSWSGLAADKNGDPFIQGPDDPFPGYYVSATDLSDRTKAANDPTRYVDASQIPYIVLPEGIETRTSAHLGDFAVVFNLQNGKSSTAIYADTGPPDRIGEGSVALAESLGLWSDARSGGTTRGILYLVFPGSGNGSPRPIGEISAEAEKRFKVWGGNNQLIACGIQ
jgi:Fungal chitosanase of glycosyl hydrolase group 75